MNAILRYAWKPGDLVLVKQKRRDAEFNPDQPRDESGKWTVSANALHDTLREHVSELIGRKVDTPLTMVENARERSVVKAHVVGSLTDRMVDELPFPEESDDPLGDVQQEVQSRIDMWAETSGDHHTGAILMQRSVQEEFGLKDAEFGHLEGIFEGMESERKFSLPEGNEEAHKLNKIFLRAQYEETQAWFKERGIKEIEIFRGTGPINGMKHGFNQTVTMQPASSWTVSRKIAGDFARYADGYVLSARVPVSRVLSTAVTGIGALPEAEVVILGGPINVDIK